MAKKSRDSGFTAQHAILIIAGVALVGLLGAFLFTSPGLTGNVIASGSPSPTSTPVIPAVTQSCITKYKSLISSDLDADGVISVCDNCPIVANPDQGNKDASYERSLGGAGDLCDVNDDRTSKKIDADGDGITTTAGNILAKIDVDDKVAYRGNPALTSTELTTLKNYWATH